MRTGSQRILHMLLIKRAAWWLWTHTTWLRRVRWNTSTVAYSSTNVKISSTGDQGRAVVWDVRDTGPPSEAVLPQATGCIVQLMPVLQQSHLLVAGCMDGRVAVWNWRSRQLLACPHVAMRPGPMCALPHPDALCMLMVVGDGSLQAVQVPEQGPLVAVGGEAVPGVVQVACFGAGQCAAITAEGLLLLWRAAQQDGCTLDVRVQGLAGCGERLVLWGAEIGCFVLHHASLC